MRQEIRTRQGYFFFFQFDLPFQHIVFGTAGDIIPFFPQAGNDTFSEAIPDRQLTHQINPDNPAKIHSRQSQTVLCLLYHQFRLILFNLRFQQIVLCGHPRPISIFQITHQFFHNFEVFSGSFDLFTDFQILPISRICFGKYFRLIIFHIQVCNFFTYRSHAKSRTHFPPHIKRLFQHHSYRVSIFNTQSQVDIRHKCILFEQGYPIGSQYRFAFGHIQTIQRHCLSDIVHIVYRQIPPVDIEFHLLVYIGI